MIPRLALAAAAVAAAGIGTAVALAPSTARARSSSKGRRRPVDPSEFPGLLQLNGEKYAEMYLERAEAVSRIPGLTTFGLATSFGESAWNNLAARTVPSEAAAACKAWKYQKTRSLRDTPFRSDDFWCWGAGGWYGLLPAYALARDPFTDLNPIWAVHDPATSTAMFVAEQEAVIRKYLPKLPPEHQNWLALRRAMASLKTFYDYNETSERARDVRTRLERHLKKIGADPDFMYEKPVAMGYPGNRVVWDALKAVRPVNLAIAA